MLSQSCIIKVRMKVVDDEPFSYYDLTMLSFFFSVIEITYVTN